MTEFGTYAVDVSLTITVTMTADPVTDFSAVCTDADQSGCYTAAGDSNGDYGVNPSMTATVSFPDMNTMILTPNDGSGDITFQRIVQNGPFAVPQ